MRFHRGNRRLIVLAFLFCQFTQGIGGKAEAAEYRVATFEADITIPVGRACMGGGIADAREIVDPLFAKGFVLLGADQPVVVIALDWCQCNNDSYDRWRDVLAAVAGTTRRRVMLATVHQHDAPICDLTAQKLLDEQGIQATLMFPTLASVADSIMSRLIAGSRSSCSTCLPQCAFVINFCRI